MDVVTLERPDDHQIGRLEQGRGEYLARAGDCIACHTAPSGKPFAGGLKFDTPICAIYSTNITPEHDTGIGTWSFEQFGRAVREGIKPNGDTLHSAMRYPSCAHLSDNDMRALHGYLKKGGAPVAQKDRPVDIVWPLSMRWLLGIWCQLFAPQPAAFDTEHYADPVVARGVYLVQGLGHCSACHTPRAATLQERAWNDSSAFLAGGAACDGWIPASLRGNPRGLGTWSETDIIQFLKSGRTDHAAAFGDMTDVVQHSTQHMNDADLGAIAHYLMTVPSNDAHEARYEYNDTVTRAPRKGDATVPGAAVSRDICNACHRRDGRGYARVFPALAANPVVQSTDATSLVRTLLTGGALAGTKAAPSSFTMPAFGWRLSDQEVADVSDFVPNSWGDTGPGAADVGQVRATVVVRAPEMPLGASPGD